MIDKYVKFIKNYKSQIDKSCPQIIISGLPLVSESTEYCNKEDKYKGAGEKSKELNKLCNQYCKSEKLMYVDNNCLETGVDGVHLTEKSHVELAQKLYDLIKQNI